MKDKTLTFNGPFEAMLEVVITDGKQFGKATLSLGHGEYPTPEKINSAIESLKKKGELPKGFHVASKSEWWECVCQEQLGTRMAMPGSKDWDK